MGGYAIRRLVEITIIFWVILTVLFFLFRMAPGDPVSRIVDPSMTPEEATALRESMGLDRPLGIQYAIFLKNMTRGDLGVSFHYGRPVVEIIAQRLPNTILLFTTSVLLSATVGVALGKRLAWRKGQRIDTIVTIGALCCHTLFLPWIALLILWGASFHAGGFPITGMVTPELWIDPSVGWIVKIMDVIHHMALPLTTLFIIHFGSYLLIMRSSMLDTLSEDYIVTARAKGLTERMVRDRHAAPNAALPVVTSVGLSLAFSINGGALTETVFSWPGLGRELVFAVSNSDYPLALAAFVLIAAVVLIANAAVDLLYAVLDPRIRYE